MIVDEKVTAPWPEVNGDWIEGEFNKVDFGDVRLNRRFIKTAQKLAQKPSEPINQACDDWAQTKGAYRLFQNERVEAGEILHAHRQQTVERLKGLKMAFAIQDTTFLDYQAHPKTQGLGSIGRSGDTLHQGLIFHSTFVLNEHGVPLGFLEQQIWAREDRSNLSRLERKKKANQKPIENKESYRWIWNMETAVRYAPQSVHLVTIADRECDIFEFMARAHQLESSFIIRGKSNRLVEAPEGLKTIRGAFKDQVECFRTDINVPARDGKPARKASVEIRYMKSEMILSSRPKTA